MAAAQREGCPPCAGLVRMLEHPLGLGWGTYSSRTCVTPPGMEVTPASLFGCGEPHGLPQGTAPASVPVGTGGRWGQCHNRLLTGVPPQAYVNMALFENFTYAGIDATAEEA